MLVKYIYTPDLFSLAPRRREQPVNHPNFFIFIPNPVILMSHRLKFGGQKCSAFCGLQRILPVLEKSQEIVTHFCLKLVKISINVHKESPCLLKNLWSA